MTLDHVGIFLQNMQNTAQIGDIFRIFGRMAFPLFLFIIVEGVRHTRHFGKYILRLSILAVVFLVGQIIFYYCINNGVKNFYSPLLDVVLVATMIYLIKRKDNFSILAVIPIAWIILSFIVTNIERNQNITIFWMPFYLRVPYAMLDIALALSFYFAKPLAESIMKESDNTKALIGTSLERYAINGISAFAVIFFSIVFYLIFKFTNVTYWNDSYQVYSCLAFLPLLFYSGARGYDKKWFKYGAYIYIPMHLIIIYLIFALI